MLNVVFDCQQAAVKDPAHGTVQGSRINFWLAWHIGSMLDSKQSCAEPVQRVQVHASLSVSSESSPSCRAGRFCKGLQL